MQTQNEFSQDSEFTVLSASPSIWKVIVTSIQTLSEDATFEVDSDGLRTRAMDPSHVALLDVKFPPGSFENYHCVRPVKFTVHLEDLTKIVKRAESKESFQVSRTKNRSLEIKIGSGHYRKEFELHLIDDDLKSSPLPKLSFTTRFSIGVDAFYQMLTDISVFSSSVGVAVSGGSVSLSGKGDSGKAEVKIGKGDGALLQEAFMENESEETKAYYGLEYLLKIVKTALPFSDLVKFEYSSKMPLRLEFFSLEKRSAGPLQFYLAPKMMD
jgi:proliferating cell nuclear antigen